MTTLSKRVGGPINLAGIVFGGGALFGGGAVAGADGNATLIEKLGDNNNPYFVSTKFLRSISDYR